MIKELIDFFDDKKVLILGFGKEGESTYNFIRKYLKKKCIYISDKNENLLEKYEYLKDDNNVILCLGNDYLSNLNDYDIIMKSPGISLLGNDISEYRDNIFSQIELFLRFFKGVTIGITGTKGKSTTSSLIYQVLKDQNVNTILLGNIGIPIFSYIDEIKDDEKVVLELSSHQLEYIHYSPNIAIFLNVYEEHLDHYGSFLKYVLAKCNIFKYQSSNDYLLYNYDSDVINKYVKDISSKVYRISMDGKEKSDIYIDNDKIYFQGKYLIDKNIKRNLLGDYNLSNILYVLGVSEILGLDLKKTINSISNFSPLHHRLELVGKVDDVYYYDNSIATIPMATIGAIEALGNVDTLIIGGMDRNIDYSSFVDYLNKSGIRNIICMPKIGHDISKKIVGRDCYLVNTMEEAVSISKSVTMKNKSCLLSPTAASYGYFKNFEERGDVFKKSVLGN